MLKLCKTMMFCFYILFLILTEQTRKRKCQNLHRCLLIASLTVTGAFSIVLEKKLMSCFHLTEKNELPQAAAGSIASVAT